MEPKKTSNREFTSRMELNIGKKCNIDCKFCFYLDQLDQPFEDYDALICRLKKYREIGINKIHIVGGEPTIYKRLFDLVRDAKDLGFINTGVITNGIMLKNKAYVEQCKEAGIEFFAISLHGHTPEIHNELTQSKNSFEFAMRGIENLKELGIPFFINLVVTKKNLPYLVEFSELMVKLKPGMVTYLYFNPVRFATSRFASNMVDEMIGQMQEKHSNTSNYLNESVKLLDKNNIKVYFKFLPYCVLTSPSEHFLGDVLQGFYEDWEWNYQKSFLLDAGKKEYRKMQLICFKNFSKEQINNLPLRILTYINCVSYSNFVKPESCKNCKYFYICLGINENYVNFYGDKEFIPVPGEKYVNPATLLYKDEPDRFKLSLREKIINNLIYFISKHFYAKTPIPFKGER